VNFKTGIWLLAFLLVLLVVGWILYHQPWLILVFVGSTLGGAWAMWKFARQSEQEASQDNEMELISSQIMQQLMSSKREKEADLISSAQTAFNLAMRNCPATYEYLFKYLLSCVWHQKGSVAGMEKALKRLKRVSHKIAQTHQPC
jgi:hypothetical protein